MTARSLILSAIIAMLVLPAAQAPAQDKKGACHVLVLAGLPGTPIHARHFDDWSKRFADYFVKQQGVPAANVIVLSGDKDFKDAIVSGPSTKEEIAKRFAELAKKVEPQDQFVFILMGHGNTTDKEPALCLPGPDITDVELARMLAGVTAKNQVVLNFSAACGPMMKTFTKANRVNVSATMPKETAAEPVTAEFFLRGIEKAADGSFRADGEGGKKDGVVTVLEAYNWSAHQVAQWTVRIILEKKAAESDAPDTWLVNGKESVEIFKKLYVAPAGTPGARILSDKSDGAAEDVIRSLSPKDDAADPTALHDEWADRRLVSEHAAIDDVGIETGDKVATCLQGCLGAKKSATVKQYEPITGDGADKVGALARRVVLGKAELLPAPTSTSAPK